MAAQAAMALTGIWSGRLRVGEECLPRRKLGRRQLRLEAVNMDVVGISTHPELRRSRRVRPEARFQAQRQKGNRHLRPKRLGEPDGNARQLAGRGRSR
jgi:hypothetical protein